MGLHHVDPCPGFAEPGLFYFVNNFIRNYLFYIIKKLNKGTVCKFMNKVEDFKKKYCCPAVIMGDFNDSPVDKSISVALGAKPLVPPYSNASLYNMFHQFMKNPFFGTHKYQSEWSILDQIIVSGNLLNSGKLRPENAYIFKASFLFEADKKNLNVRPKRTYNGLRYNGGYSDHLPIVVELF